MKVKNSLRFLSGVAVGILLSGSVVYAANLLSSSEVTYTNSGSSVTNVKDALDELYSKKSVASCEYEIGQTFTYDYIGDTQVFVTACSGNYKLEVWGAQGGTANTNGTGGYGGYSVGEMSLSAYQLLYINVGSAGTDATSTTTGKPEGGYNGGGNGSGYCSNFYGAGGGGATHIALSAGLLSSFESKTDKIVLVAGGGGGGGHDVYLATRSQKGGVGGGFTGGQGETSGTGGSPATQAGGGGTQSSGGTTGSYGATGAFGKGATSPNTACSGWGAGAGGGGFYGGGSGNDYGASGGGGSGYLSGSLTNKKMVCYNCEENGNDSTKTESTTCVEETPTSNCAKVGNGYAKITYLGSN